MEVITIPAEMREHMKKLHNTEEKPTEAAVTTKCACVLWNYLHSNPDTPEEVLRALDYILEKLNVPYVIKEDPKDH